MRIGRSVVLILLLAMFDTWHHFNSWRGVTLQLVGDEHAWDIPQPVLTKNLIRSLESSKLAA
jgi:hypothetical protein